MEVFLLMQVAYSAPRHRPELRPLLPESSRIVEWSFDFMNHKHLPGQEKLWRATVVRIDKICA